MIEISEKRPWNVFTLGNFITALRLAFGTFSVLLYLNGRNFLAAFFFGLAAVTDFFDGYVARWREKKNGNGISRFGEVFDPICDKLLIIPGVIIQSFLAGIVIVEIFSTAYALHIRERMGFHFISKWSKAATFVQLPSVALLFLARTPFESTFLVVVVYTCSFIRFLSYFIKDVKLTKETARESVSKMA